MFIELVASTMIGLEGIRFLHKAGMIIVCVASDVQRERRGESRTAKHMKTYNLDGRVTSLIPHPVPGPSPWLVKTVRLVSVLLRGPGE